MLVMVISTVVNCKKLLFIFLMIFNHCTYITIYRCKAVLWLVNQAGICVIIYPNIFRKKTFGVPNISWVHDYIPKINQHLPV